MAMRTPLRRALGWLTPVREEETTPAMLMFAYSFLAMTSYNILKPLTRSQFIATLGSENLPYVLFAAGILIGVVMHFYTNAIRRVPRQHVVPVTQAAIVGLLIVFWALLRTGAVWVPVAFYFFGLILGILLISQFWTLANDIFDARQAKRLFGFIGGGASLGGAPRVGPDRGHRPGGGLGAARAGQRGQPWPAAPVSCCWCCAVTTSARRPTSTPPSAAWEGREAIQLIAGSSSLRVLALTVGCAAAGAAVLDQQLSMAAEAMRGDSGGDSIAAFLAEVTAYLSIAGFVVQVAFISRIHRSAGIGVALLLLPIGFSTSALVILVTGDPVGGGGGPGPRLDAALHAGQDHARSALRAPVDRAAAPGQAVHRRHDGPVREGADGGRHARPHPALGPRTRLAPVELRHPRDHRTLDRGRVEGATRVPPGVPRQHRYPDHRARGGHDDGRGGRHRGDPGGGALQPRRPPGAVRHRDARGDGQAASRHPAAVASRVGRGPGEGPFRRWRRAAPASRNGGRASSSG